MKNILIWLLRAIVALIMLETLFYKFSAHPESVALFTQLGMEPWGRIGVGIFELIASVLLLYPRFNWAGAMLTMGLMAGAIFFHLTTLGFEGNNGNLFVSALIAFAGATTLLYLHKEQLPIKKLLGLKLS